MVVVMILMTLVVMEVVTPLVLLVVGIQPQVDTGTTEEIDKTERIVYIHDTMVQNIREIVETYEEVSNSDSVEMGSINYLQEVEKSTKNEISTARKKNVIVDEFNYNEFHGNPVREYTVDSLINRIFRFSLEAKERK